MKPQFCQSGSLPQEQAVELMELSRQRLLQAGAGFRAWRVTAAVWAQTVPFSRGWDTIFVEELGRLAGIKDRRDARRAVQEAAQAGAIEWEPSRWIPPKGQPGRPSLVGLPGAPKRGAQSPHLTDAKRGAQSPHNKALSDGVEVMSDAVSIDTGTHHSPLIGHRAPNRVDGSEDWEAEREARPQARPEPDWDWDAYDSAVDAAWQAAEAERAAHEVFPPFHGDERTGDGVGDDERSQVKWAADNPSKARGRRRARN